MKPKIIYIPNTSLKNEMLKNLKHSYQNKKSSYEHNIPFVNISSNKNAQKVNKHNFQGKNNEINLFLEIIKRKVEKDTFYVKKNNKETIKRFFFKVHENKDERRI